MSDGIEIIRQARAAARERFKACRDEPDALSSTTIPDDPDNPSLADDDLKRFRPAHEVNPRLVAMRLRARGAR